MLTPRIWLALSALIALALPASPAAAGGSVPVSPTGWQVVAPQRSMPLFHLATGIAVDRSRNVYVSDSVEGRVRKFSSGGKLLAVWGSDAPGPTHWYPTGVAVDAQAHVYVLVPDQEPWQMQTGSHIVKLTPRGRVMAQWDAGAAQAIAVGGGGSLFVLSTDPPGANGWRGSRIDKLSSQGTITATWHTPPLKYDTVRANGIAVDPRGNVYVTVAAVDMAPRAGPLVTAALYRFSPSGARVRIHPKKASLGPVQAVDGSGNIYLAPDEYSGGPAIEKLSPSGTLLARWTAAGRDPLASHIHVALDERGNLYVADSRNVSLTPGWADNGLIHVLSPSGALLARWGEILPTTSFPVGLSLALGPGGTIYTTTTLPYVFLTVSPDGRIVRQVGRTSARPPVISIPEAITVDGHGYVYVLDASSGHVDKLSPDGRVLAQWALLKPGQGPMNGIALDRAGNIYVLVLDQIVKVSPSGKILARYGSRGSGPGQFMAPYSLTLDAAGNIYVADTQNNRIQKISPKGRWLASWGSLPEIDRPVGVAVDGAGHVFALDPIRSDIVEYAPGGAILARWGAQGVLPGQLGHPTSLAIDGHGTIYVLDYDNNRIQKLVRKG